jgi:glycosyltransferase involved in cell wall biosynthesis
MELLRLKMEIGIISSRYPIGPKHDAGRAVYSFAHGLAKLGHNVKVYTYNGGRMTMKYWETKQLQIISIGVIATMPIKSGLIYEDTESWNEGVWQEIEHEDTTQLLLVFDWYGFRVAHRHREAHKSLVVGVVGALSNGRGSFVPFTDVTKLADFKSRELEFLRSSDYLIAFNKCSANEVAKLTDVPCTTIPLGIDPIDCPIQRPTTRGNVLVVGRISREKVLEALLRAIVDNFWVELTLCGNGADTDYGKYIAKLAKERLDISNRITFVDGPPEHYYSMAEIVVCPSIYDPFSYQVYDAYNNCLPVIGHFMSYSDVIKNKDTGYCYQSIGELSKVLNLLHNSNSLRKQLALAGKAEVMEMYTTTRSMERMDHLLMQLTDGAYRA